MTLNKTATFYSFAFLSIAIGLYPLMYFMIDREFGLLDSKPAELLAHLPWNIGFYTHIILGGMAVLGAESAVCFYHHPTYYKFINN